MVSCSSSCAGRTDDQSARARREGHSVHGRPNSCLPAGKTNAAAGPLANLSAPCALAQVIAAVHALAAALWLQRLAATSAAGRVNSCAMPWNESAALLALSSYVWPAVSDAIELEQFNCPWPTRVQHEGLCSFPCLSYSCIQPLSRACRFPLSQGVQALLVAALPQLFGVI